MKKILKKSILIMTILSMFMFVLSNNLKILTSEFETMAESYRTTYTIYGDLNNDKKIDSFDVVVMRQKVLSKDTSKELDFNYDGKVDASDLKLLSDYVLGKISILDIYFYDDADKDGLCDLLEVSLKTNPDSLDTDGDTLSDFDEVVYTKTSPTDKYTNKLSVTDADDDSDGDKLTNKEELSYKTNPFLSDSDFDGVNDYDEIKKYMTDPNNDDSDNDNIIDGDEIKLGLKPNTDKSDGTVIDSQRTFKQNIEKSSEILSYINVDDNPYELSIDIVSAGIAEKELSVSVGEFSNCSENERIIGKSVLLDYNNNLSVDSAKIYFSPQNIDGKISDYMIFEFFPDNNYLLPVETKYTKESAYVETNELGTFCLVNIKDMFQATSNVSKSSIESKTSSIVWNYELGETEVVFLVDISGALDSNLEETKNSIHDFSQALFEHTGNGAVSIFGYYANPTTAQTQIIPYADSSKNTILISMKSVNEALNGISSYTTNKNNPLISPISLVESLSNDNLFSSTCPNKYAFIISDSTYSFTNSSGFSLVVPKPTCKSLKNIYNNNVHLNFVLSEDSFKQTKAINNLKKECQPYDFGVYSKSKTGYFANDIYAKIYSDAVIDLMEIPVVYTSSVMPYRISRKVERNAFINSLPKSVDSSKVPSADADGNIDFKDTVDKIGLKFENLRSACDVFDLTHRGYEQLMTNQDMSVNLIIGGVQVTPFSDKILYADNDNDGIPNKDDPYPEESFDDRFEIVNDYRITPKVKFVEEEYIKSKADYSSETSIPNEILQFGSRIIWGIGSIIGKGALASIGLDILNGQFTGIGELKNASFFLDCFLLGIYKHIELSHGEVCDAILSTSNNVIHLKNNIQSLMSVVEETTNNNSISLSTTYDSGFMSCCYYNHGNNCNLDHTQIDRFESLYSLDWYNTTGESFGGMTCIANNNGKEYNMTFRYYIIDIYEWVEDNDNPPSMSDILHALHKAGQAKEFLYSGYFESKITWKKGEKINNEIMKQIYNDMLIQMELDNIISKNVFGYDKLIGSGENPPKYDLYRTPDNAIIILP